MSVKKAKVSTSKKPILTGVPLSNEQAAEYSYAFRLFDRDQDNLITPKDLSLLIRSLERNPSDAEIQQLIEQLVHRDGNLIDSKQFLEMMSILKKQQINNRKREFREIFTSIDTDGDGFIDAEELRSTLRILFPGNDEMKLTDEELNEMISEFDSDHDNRLNFDDFMKIFAEEDDIN